MRMIQSFFKRFALEIAVILALAVISVAEPGFLSMRNFRNIVMIASPLMIMGAGFSLCLINGLVDFSCASVAALAGVVAASLSQNEDAARRMFSDALSLPLPAVLLVALLIALSAALLASLSAAFAKVPSYIGSIALGGISSAAISVYLELPEGGFRTLSGFTEGFSRLGSLFFGGSSLYAVPLAFVIALAALALLFALMMNRKIASHFNAVQDEPNKAVQFLKVFAIFAIANILYALSGCIEAARENRVSVGFWGDALFSVIAGTLLGTVSVRGGRGTVLHAAAGIFLVSALQYALTFMGAQSGIQKICLCALMVLAVALDNQTARRAVPLPLEQEKNPAE